MFDVLEGNAVTMRKATKDDSSQVRQWVSDRKFMGKYQPINMVSEEYFEKVIRDHVFFIIEKNGVGIGYIDGWRCAWMDEGTMEIGFALVSNERGKGYGTKAIRRMITYLFDEDGIAKVHALVDIENVASQKALEKAGFLKNENLIRKLNGGKIRVQYVYSLNRKEHRELKRPS